MRYELVNVESSENTSKEDYDDTYRIYEYMKDHTSMLIASVSAIVAVGSIFSSVLIYIYQCLILQYWNVPTEFIGEVKRGRFFYIIIIGAIYYGFALIYQMYVINVFEKNLYIIEIINLEMKLLKKRCKLQKINYKKTLGKDFSSYRKHINDYKRYSFIQIVKSLTGVSIIWLILFSFFMLSIGNIYKHFYDYIISLWIFLILFCWINFKFKYMKNIKHKFKNKNAENNSEELEVRNELENILKDVSKSTIKNKAFREYFCDKNISILLVLILSMLVALLFFFISYSLIIPRLQKEFLIFKDESGQSYAVVYQNENQLILEEAFILDKNILINVNKQLFISYQENLFEYMTFDRVERIEGIKHKFISGK